MTDKASANIVELETRFWQSMIDKDAKTAAAMIADQSIVTGPMGAMQITPQKYEEMTRDGKWTLEAFEFSDVDVIFPSDDVAVIAYKVHQTGTMADKAMDLTCADSSTWVHDGNGWKCALHTETILADHAVS
ncbi:uncharacterized protein DUF4440 [Novosphingobium kunmingense]|uniref:Uncharacterized protein DUF4440 n=1 Tax=Novosphingobium kunmingense TaxID=1211806 RepID=A0A2N0I3N3_9SPHN|nr:nuclear transport factor 2 family protein [Novosphingobium kunmingense]PKB25791.1 uncharacterized protein DUF4440 [Novosphingobium kunmingense]